MDNGLAQQDLIQQLINALSAAYSVGTSDNIRVQASQYLESFKTTQPPLTVLNTSLELIRNQQYNTQIRHYGFQAFQYILQKRYSTFSPLEKASIKTQLIDLIKPQQNVQVVPPPSGLPQELTFSPPQFIQSPLINYQAQQNSILTSKVVSLLAHIAVFDWPDQFPAFLPTLMSFVTQCPSLDYTLFLLEIFNKIIDLTGQPTPLIPDQQRKVVFSRIIPELEQFLPHYFKSVETILAIIACDISTIQQQLPYIYTSFPQLTTAIMNFATQRTANIADPLFSTYIKHVLQITLYLNQHITERINFSQHNLTTHVSLLATMLSLPETCDEISEHVIILLQRKQGVPLALLPETLLRLWQTLTDLSQRILSRQTICNERYKLFPQRSSASSQTLSAFLQRQPLLTKVLNSLQHLITSYSNSLNSIITAQSDKVKLLEQLQLQNPQTFHTDPNNTNALNEAKQILFGIDNLRTTLLQVLTQAGLNLDCHDIVCSTAVQCLLECTNARTYSTYITNPFFIQQNMVEPLLAEIWLVILTNSDRQRIAHLNGKARGGIESQSDLNDEDGSGKSSTVMPAVNSIFDVLGMIRSSVQGLVKQIVTRSPHLILKFISQLYHKSIASLLEIAQLEQQHVQNNRNPINQDILFPTTIENHAKNIQYIFQTSSEFNKALYPSHHFGYRQFFISQAFLDLETLTSNTKTIFQQLQLLINRVSRDLSPSNPDHLKKVELNFAVDFTSDWSTLSYNYVEALLPYFEELHRMLLSCPTECLGYQTFTINILAKLTPLYSLSQPHLQQTVMILLKIGRLNPNNMLGRTSYIGSTRHDGLNYNHFFINPLTNQLITNPAECQVDALVATSGTGEEGINMGPLLDLRKHALHAILHLTKHLPQSFEASYIDFCTHVLQLIHPTQPQPQPQQREEPPPVTIPTEAIVLTEIILCLGLYFNNEAIVQSVYNQLLLPHLNYITTSPDVAFFLSDPFRFSTLLYGSKDEYKLIQLQLLQWNNVNKNPTQAASHFGSLDTANSQHVLPRTTTDDTQDTHTDRNSVLPRAFSAKIHIPTSSNFDNRYQSCRKQVLFALHSLQCVAKLLYTQTLSAQSFDLSTLSPHLHSGDIVPNQHTHSAIQQQQYDQAQKEYQRLVQQGKTARDLLFTIVSTLYSPLLRITVMYLVCTTESHISQLSNRLHSLSIGSGFEYFLSLFTADRFIISTQSTTSANQFDPNLTTQQTIDQVWAQGDQILHGFLDSSYLPSNLNDQNIPAKELISPAKLKVLPADKSQSLLRHLWTWGDSVFEVLTQLLQTLCQVSNDLVAIDILCLPNQVQSHDNSAFFTGNPSTLFQTITQQTLRPLPHPHSNLLISQTTPAALAQYNSYFWLLLFALIPSTPLRKQRLITQRVIQPLFRLLPYHSLALLQSQFHQSPSLTNQTEPTCSTPALIQQRFQFIDQNLTAQLVSKQLFSATTPYLLSSTISLSIVSLIDAMIAAQYAHSSTQTTNITLSPTLSYIADAIGANSLTMYRRLRGNSANLEHLRFIPNRFIKSISSHGGPENSDPTQTTAIYSQLHSLQHIIATTPFSTTFNAQLEQNPGQTLTQLPLSSISLSPSPPQNPLTQQQSALLNTILTEIRTNAQQNRMNQFPGELDNLCQNLTSILQRYDFSRLITTLQLQESNPAQQFPKAFNGDPLHTYIEQLDFSETQSSLQNLNSLLSSFVTPRSNNERNMNNAYSTLKQAQMFLALPLCQKLAEYASVTPSVCYQLSSIWEMASRVNFGSAAELSAKYIFGLLRYVGVVVCYASICLAQRQQQQLAQSQGHPAQPLFMLEAENIGLYYRLLYYQPLISAITANKSASQQTILSNHASSDPQYNGLLVKKSPTDMKQLLFNAKADVLTVFQTDDYWLHLAQIQEQQQNPQQQQQQPSADNLGLTDAFLSAAPRLLEWLQHLFKRTIYFLQRHLYASLVLDLTEKQQQQAQPFGSPILSTTAIDHLIILARDTITLISQCQSYVSFDHIQQLFLNAIQPIDTSRFPLPQSQPQPTQQQFLSPEIIALIVNYARKTDTDEVSHDGSGGSGNSSDSFYFSHLATLSRKGVMSEKNLSQPMLPIPNQTRAAKEQFKSLLMKVLHDSLGITQDAQ